MSTPTLDGAFCGRCGLWNPAPNYRSWRKVREDADLHLLYCEDCRNR